MTDVYFSLGSNLGDRKQNLDLATTKLVEKIGSLKKSSGVYESEPWGYKDQNQYLNQVICIESELEPTEILKIGLAIEISMGRERSGWQGYESRTMDVDVLFYDQLEMHTAELTIPHPKMHLRNFVLIPMMEIAPDFIHPFFRHSISELKENCNDKAKVSSFFVA